MKLYKVIPALPAMALFFYPSYAAAQSTLNYSFVDTYSEFCGAEDDDDGCAEISAYEPDLNRIFTTNGAENALRVLGLQSNNKLTDIGTVALDEYGAAPNSVAVSNGVVAVAMEADNKQENGNIVFLDASSLDILAAVEAGPLPDMVAYTPDGNYLVVANEGEPSDDYSVDPEGSITIIDIQTRVARQADFSAFNQSIDPAVRVFGPGASVAQDLEPEYITLSPDSTTAFVALQENNALAVVDIANATVTDVVALGFKDHSLPGNGFDASNRDGSDSCANQLEDAEECISIKLQPTLGMYQPDALASYTVNGQLYVVSANEGDARDYDGYSEEFRVGDEEFILDEAAYPNAQQRKDDSDLGRLKTTNATGDTDGDGDIDQIYSYGARSFSIWSASGELVYDSGDEFEQRLLELQLAGNDVWADNRSDDKGPEPESLTVAEIAGKHIAFIGLERVSGIMVYDISNPTAAAYLGYIDTKKAGDISPEGLVYVPRSDDRGVLIVTNEISNTTSTYQVAFNTSMSDAPIIGEGTILVNSTDYFQVQTSDTYEAICEGTNVGLCQTGPGVFNVINLTTGERFESLTVPGGSVGGGTTDDPVVNDNIISWGGNGYFQVQSVDDFSTLCEGSDINQCAVPEGTYHVINHLSGQRYEFISVGGDNGGGASGESFSLKILHINDHHSHLESDSMSLMLDGQETSVDVGGFPRIVSKMQELEAESSAVLKLHAGDAITGTLLYTLFRGEADAALMNAVCFDAFALGNHEFDGGDEGLVEFLDNLNSTDCMTDVLAANVVPEVGVSPLALTSATDYLMPFTIKAVDNERVGIIGIDIANKTKNSSSPDETTLFLDETTTAQRTIDLLRNSYGIDKIVLLTHYQYRNDIELAKALDGVDIIVGGDSHSLLGDGFADLGLNPVGPYPTEAFNAGGNKVCIVQAWEYALLVGELNAGFDRDGNIVSCEGTPHLMLGDTFEREDESGEDVVLTGAEREGVLSSIENAEELSIVTPDADADSLLAGFVAQADTLGMQAIGTASENFCLERIPGQGRSLLCNVSETASQGSDISNLVALAFKTQSITSDIAIQNAGGVRIDVPAGDLTVDTAYTLLPFANTLVEISMSGQQIVDTLEDALDFALAEDGSSGAYPYASGLRWDVDASMVKGSRFSNVEVKLKGETSWSPINREKTYKVVTNSFIAGGRDGYQTLGIISDDSKVDTFLDYAQSFVDYVLDQGTVGKLPLEDYSTQSYTNQDGMLQ